MKQFVCLILCVVSCLGLLCSCGKDTQEPVGSQEEFVFPSMCQDCLYNAMAEAFAKKYNCSAGGLSVDYLGAYHDCHVAFFDGPFFYTTAVVEQQIGEITFVYPDSQKLQVYRNGIVLELSEAYEAGWVSDEMLAQIHADYMETKQRIPVE